MKFDTCNSKRRKKIMNTLKS